MVDGEGELGFAGWGAGGAIKTRRVVEGRREGGRVVETVLVMYNALLLRKWSKYLVLCEMARIVADSCSSIDGCI